MYPIRTHVHVYSECFFGSMAGGGGWAEGRGREILFVGQYTFMPSIRCAVYVHALCSMWVCAGRGDLHDVLLHDLAVGVASKTCRRERDLAVLR